MSKGYIYILSNPSLKEDVYKIGRSKYSGNKRASELYTTGVPTPFHVEFEILVEDPVFVEQGIHESLKEYRISGNREFFQVSLFDAVRAVLKESLNQHELCICEPEEYDAIEGIRKIAYKADIHPIILGSAIHLIKPEEAKEAVERKYSSRKKTFVVVK